MNKNNNAVEAKKIFAKFPESIFFSTNKIENNTKNVQKNNFYFSFYINQKINISNGSNDNNPRIYLQGLDKLFDMSATSGNDNPMVNFAQALISSDSDWEIEYKKKTDYGNNCIRISKSNSQSENTNDTDSQSEQALNLTFQLMEPYLFDAIFTDYEAIKVTVHFVNFDDNDKHIKQDYIIMAKELAFVDEIKLYDANGNKANAIPHGETASLQWSGGNINKCKVSLHGDFDEKEEIKNIIGKTNNLIQEADLPAIDRDRIFTLNLEKDDRTTSLKIPVFEAPYFDDISVFDSEGNKIATALDSKGQKFHVIHKGDEATIKWYGGNSEKCNSTLYKKDENGQEKEISPDNVKINKDTTFKLVLERNGCKTSTEFTIRCTGWKKEGVCKNLPLTTKEKTNTHFLYKSNSGIIKDSFPIGYYINIYRQLFFSLDLIEWMPCVTSPCTLPSTSIPKTGNFKMDIYATWGYQNYNSHNVTYTSSHQDLILGECYKNSHRQSPYQFVGIIMDIFGIEFIDFGGLVSSKIIEMSPHVYYYYFNEDKINKDEKLLSCQIVKVNDKIWWIAICDKGIHLFTPKAIEGTYRDEDLLADLPIVEEGNIIYSDFMFPDGKTFYFASLCDNNYIYIALYDITSGNLVTLEPLKDLEGKHQTRISWVITDSLYNLVLDNYILKLYDNKIEITDTYISPMDSMKDKNQGMVLIGPKEENGKSIIAAIVQDEKETSLWTYNDDEETQT